MQRACGCRADPIVFGHTECQAGPPWIIQRIYQTDCGLTAHARMRP